MCARERERWRVPQRMHVPQRMTASPTGSGTELKFPGLCGKHIYCLIWRYCHTSKFSLCGIVILSLYFSAPRLAYKSI